MGREKAPETVSFDIDDIGTVSFAANGDLVNLFYAICMHLKPKWTERREEAKAKGLRKDALDYVVEVLRFLGVQYEVNRCPVVYMSIFGQQDQQEQPDQPNAAVDCSGRDSASTSKKGRKGSNPTTEQGEDSTTVTTEPEETTSDPFEYVPPDASDETFA